jgi:hypothetical protein
MHTFHAIRRASCPIATRERSRDIVPPTSTFAAVSRHVQAFRPSAGSA